jgi:ribosomal protein L40E
MTHVLVCWKCGASLADYTLPLRRLEECRQCHAELHVCRMCEWYSVTVAKHCREPIAEEVKDKERANFCDYFKARPNAHQPVSGAAVKARSELEALFGKLAADPVAPSAADPAAASRAQLDELFRKK